MVSLRYTCSNDTNYAIRSTKLWAKWNHEYTVSTKYYANVNPVEITSSSSSSTTIWPEWNTAYQPVTYITNQATWENWVVVCNDGYSTRTQPRQLTEEERAEREARVAEGRRLQAEAAAAAKAASERALTLLLSALDEEQAAEYTEHQRFHVTATSGRRYCIKHGRQHNVFLVDADGRAVREYCGHVGESVPNEDNILAQKLLLEADEEAFIRVANARAMAPTPV